MPPLDAGSSASASGYPHPEQGLSLRQYYAAAALQGLCANAGGPFQRDQNRGWSIINCTMTDIASAAFALADAMIEVDPA